MSDPERLAGCACGQLRVTCSGEPLQVSLCSCLACQRRTGSAFGVAAFFDRDRVQSDGESRLYRRAADPGSSVDFHFCPACGSTVYWEPSRKPGLVAVAVGCFADPSFPAPVKSVYEDHRHPWLALSLRRELPGAGAEPTRSRPE